MLTVMFCLQLRFASSILLTENKTRIPQFILVKCGEKQNSPCKTKADAYDLKQDEINSVILT